MIRTVIEPQASSDIMEAAEWYETQLTGLGVEFVLEVNRAIDKVQENPRLYYQVYRGVRRVLSRRFPYAIYYLLSETEIRILAVLHQSRSDETIVTRLG